MPAASRLRATRVRNGTRGATRATRTPSTGSSEAALAGDRPAKQQRAHHRDDCREERDAEAHHAHRGEYEAHDRDDAGRAGHEHELIGAPLTAAPRGRSA